MTISKQEQDRSLPDKFREEAEGIIAWIVEGARRWYSEGLGKPLEVMEAGNAWRSESDVLTPFIDEVCEADPDAQAPLGDIWNAYEIWAAENSSRRILDRTEFNCALENRGHKKGRCKNTRFWSGLRLRGNPEVTG